jgi:hypothetical protein
VLAENPAFEATVLALDASRDDPFAIRRAYEHTHASNNFHAARRYPNLVDDRATRSFIAKTHEWLNGGNLLPADVRTASDPE